MTENLDRAPERATGGAGEQGGTPPGDPGGLPAGPDKRADGARSGTGPGANSPAVAGPIATGPAASGQAAGGAPGGVAAESGDAAVLLGNGPDGDEAEGGQAPESYEAFFVPDGFAVHPGLMAEFTERARGMRLTQAQAQQLIDLQIKSQEEGLAAYREQLDAWRGEVMRDPEFGGPKLAAALRDAKRALAAYPEGEVLLEELSRTGYGNNPHIIRYFARLGREHFPSDDAVITGKEAAGKELPLEERLWPDKQR